ncbi:MAG: BREX system P-loop protein BrxC, partial [Rhodobacteraceae bacterium]|nr:BREX system P-loop protein BrxC [Paracoccaceae bacterium]
MTALRQIFAKPVDRPIDGVIKADDEASLRTELEEYVVTGEIAQRLEQFLDAYNNYDTSNGVWISGFFGSGKSHLLKMLALLLENRDVDGSTAFDIFQDKLTDNPMLAGGLRKAISIPSKSILFNIDQKADVISKSEVDALLSVFQKVFDEMCGYFGKLPHIAQFERDLDSRGALQAFKTAFAEESGKSWERGREQALMEKRHIAAAFAQATGSDADDARDILSLYRTDHKVSIEDFAETVKAWIDAQEPGFRLNFFVDEVGQYIADNIKLMTNLQTIAESLNTKCKGQAWLFVTAQQDMAAVIGDMTVQQENDFSKIQARFDNRMPLNSADVAEVIQKRLLSKTDEGEIILGNLFDHEENNLKTLFDFSDGSIRLKNYDGRDKFISSYPFPPYQYTLFQMALLGLSQHNAFEGKHSSVGERSMLGVFQEVAKHLADNKVGEIATFDLMFEGIRTALKSSAQQSIQIAEKNLDEPFAVRVLKALFLVKYVKEFKPTVRNIGILLLSRFDEDLAVQKRQIEEALATLERNTLIQRNGEFYEFLTSEEMDVEAEIKSLDVDHSEVAKELEGLVFDTIMKSRKIKHLTTGHDYAFSRKLDDMFLGKSHELAINVISPFSDEAGSPEAVRMQNMSREELAVVLSQDVKFMRELTLFKKTDKFVRQART